MTPLFDKERTLVGWQDGEHIFDTELTWVAYISGGNVWSVETRNWIGVSYGLNIRDTRGKTAFWNPDEPISNTLKPIKPNRAIKPLRPLRPIRPLKPLKPLKPLRPLGGWSELTWVEFVNG